MTNLLTCGHPRAALNKGDSMTRYCRWCALRGDIIRLEADVYAGRHQLEKDCDDLDKARADLAALKRECGG